jgi:hypothetical protein
MKQDRKMMNLGRCTVLIIGLCTALKARADGIYGNGVGARSMAMGGADVAWASDPLGAMGVNPAGLGFLARPELDLGVTGGFVDGTFNKPGVSHGNLDTTPGALPEGAFAIPIAKTPVVVGILLSRNRGRSRTGTIRIRPGDMAALLPTGISRTGRRYLPSVLRLASRRRLILNGRSERASGLLIMKTN